MAVFRYEFYCSGACRGDTRENSRENYGGNSRESWYTDSSVVCRYFLRGTCTFGARCRFSHSDTRVSSRTATAAQPAHSVPSTSSMELQEPHSSRYGFSEPMGESSSIQSSERPDPECSRNWVNAPEFIPSKRHANRITKSYAQAVNSQASGAGSSNTPDQCMVPYDCPFNPNMNQAASERGDSSTLTGAICDVCDQAVLNPRDGEQQRRHKEECVARHDEEKELKRAMDRSVDKSCGICMEVILEKKTREQRFGILPNCNHCFCLSCIRKWRQAKQFENKIIRVQIPSPWAPMPAHCSHSCFCRYHGEHFTAASDMQRACPECRVTSDFVCPSMYWVDTKEEKEALINDYKQALSVKNCKYFNVGQGKCPFGNKCFYLHAYPDGTKADVGPPVRQRRQNSEGDFGILQQIILWDFLDERDNRWLFNNLDDLEDLVAMLSDGSDDSDWSEYDFIFE